MNKQPIEFSQLKTKVADVQLTNVRLNDLPDGTEVTIKEMYESGEGEAKQTTVVLQAGNKTIEASLFAFAGMRIAEEGNDKIKALKTTDDVREEATIGTLKDQMGRENSPITAETKFKVFHRVGIINPNSKESGAMVYQNRCYEGFGDFSPRSAEIWNDPTIKDMQEKARQVQVERTKLLATDLKSGMATEKNQVRVPIFVVTQ